MNKLLARLQHLLPQQLLSRYCGLLSNTNNQRLKQFLIQSFVKKYAIDVQMAERENISEYKNFNDFFTRTLKKSLRPINQNENTIVSPVDGFVGAVGDIKQQKLLQAKDYYYDLDSLLAHQSFANDFRNGQFATLYLAPQNYHRVHMPCQGLVKESVYVPGKLFSVNRLTTTIVPNLFSRNERIITLFETSFGPMAIILVGAMLVGSMELAWQKNIPRQRGVVVERNLDHGMLQKGDEMGLFKMGSTVILLFPNGTLRWLDSLQPNSAIIYGQAIAEKLGKGGYGKV